MLQKLFFFGVGETARWVASYAANKQWQFFGTTRSANKIEELKQLQIEPILLEPGFSKTQLDSLKSFLADAYVLVSYPPDRACDQAFAQLIDQAKTVIYISSTGVYGRHSGPTNETTEVDHDSPQAKARLLAEKIWQENGAIILRAPGLYSPKNGLHIRLQEGTYKLPADGSNYTSRIHLKDFARLIVAAFQLPLPKQSLYVVGDLQPTSQNEVVSWLCKQMDLPMPASQPLDMVPPTLRGNRQVDATKILQDLNIKLEFPTYKEGYANCLSNLSRIQ